MEVEVVDDASENAEVSIVRVLLKFGVGSQGEWSKFGRKAQAADVEVEVRPSRI